MARHGLDIHFHFIFNRHFRENRLGNIRKKKEECDSKRHFLIVFGVPRFVGHDYRTESIRSAERDGRRRRRRLEEGNRYTKNTLLEMVRSGASVRTISTFALTDDDDIDDDDIDGARVAEPGYQADYPDDARRGRGLTTMMGGRPGGGVGGFGRERALGVERRWSVGGGGVTKRGRRRGGTEDAFRFGASGVAGRERRSEMRRALARGGGALDGGTGDADGTRGEFVRDGGVDAMGRTRGKEAVFSLSRALDEAYDPSTLFLGDALTDGSLKGFAAQFWEFKSMHMDCVVMVKHGSFYNMFDVDADAGMAVGLRLTGTNTGFMRKVGCRAESFEEWARRLLAQGYTVARVEQMDKKTAAKTANGVMRRECCEILTPALDRGLLQSGQANYFMTLADSVGDGEVAVCAIDAESGCAVLGKVPFDRLSSILQQYEPREVVVSETLCEENRRALATYGKSGASHRDCVLRVLERGGKKLPSITRTNVLSAMKHFAAEDSQLGDIVLNASELELRAIGFAMRHLAWVGLCETVFARMSFLNLVSVDERTKGNQNSGPASAFALPRDQVFMAMDGEAVSSLHVLRGDTGALAGSLFAYLNQTLTLPGRRRLRQFLLRPLRIESEISARLDVVQALTRDHFILQSLRNSMKHLKLDYEKKFVKACRLAVKTSKVYNIVRFNQTLTHEVDEMGLQELGPKGASTLEQVLMDAVNMVSFWEMHKRELFDFTQLLDSLIAICDVAKIIRPLAEFDTSIDGLLADVAGSREFLQELRSALVVTAIEKKCIVTPSPVVFTEFGEYAREAIRERNQDPFLRRQNEKRRKELRNLYIPLSDDEADDERCYQDADDKADLAAANAFTEVMSAFREELQRFERIINGISILDVLQGFATVCMSSRGSIGFSRAQLSSEAGKLEITRGWYPLLHPSIYDASKGISHENGIVDNDISMKKPFMLLTGPNMSGKSSLLRQIATTVIMSQIGCLVPAEKCEHGIVDSIMTRIGGDDNLASGVSTFLNEMQGASNILSKMTERSLIVLDELGRGTSTLDGYAIAYATAKYLASSTGCRPRVLFATHYHNLADELKKSDSEVDAWCVEKHIGVKSIPAGGLRFTYKLEDGPAPLGSCALNVARLAGFPPGILTRASHVAKTVKFTRTSGTEDRRASSYQPPSQLLEPKEHVSFSRLVADPAVIGDAEALGDGVAWARQFYSLWCACKSLTTVDREP